MIYNNANDLISQRRELIALENGDLSLNDIMCELYLMSTNVNCDLYSENYILSEGANIQYTEAFKTAIKKIKKHISLSAKYVKAKENDKAKAEIKAAISNVDELESNIKSIDSSAGSAIFGIFANAIFSLCVFSIPIMVNSALVTNLQVGILKNAADRMEKIKNIGATNPEDLYFKQSDIQDILHGKADNPKFKALKVATGASSIFNIVISMKSAISQLYNVYKTSKTEKNDANTLNLYRNRLLMTCTSLKKMLNFMLGKIK